MGAYYCPISAFPGPSLITDHRYRLHSTENESTSSIPITSPAIVVFIAQQPTVTTNVCLTTGVMKGSLYTPHHIQYYLHL